MPAPGYILGGFTQVGQYLYMAGSYNASPATNGTNHVPARYDRRSRRWTTGPTFTPARADFGLATSVRDSYAIGGETPPRRILRFHDCGGRTLDVSAWPAGTWVPSPLTHCRPLDRRIRRALAACGIWSTGGYNGGRNSGAFAAP
jgi:hypothetical protein